MTQLVEARVIQVSNVSPAVTKEQLQTLFSFVGTIDDLRLYPSKEHTLDNGTRLCYVKFVDRSSVGVAMHLNSVQFMERQILIYPMEDDQVSVVPIVPWQLIKDP